MRQVCDPWHPLHGEALAVGHTLLTIIYHVLCEGKLYQELGADYMGISWTVGVRRDGWCIAWSNSGTE